MLDGCHSYNLLLLRLARHNSNPLVLFDARRVGGIEKLRRHDSHRPFGSMVTTLDVPEGVREPFFNHADVSVTDTYTRAESAMLRE